LLRQAKNVIGHGLFGEFNFCHGGFWFSDSGDTHTRDSSAIYYAKTDGSSIKEVLLSVYTPNGVGLSRDASTLYVALTMGRIVVALPIRDDGTLDRGQDLIAGTTHFVAPCEYNCPRNKG
jgi:sugar lactone lactonase YvrE